ncbi:MAG: hypothetical protein AMJ65_12550 [Phycisphaerae bacterium SG8_4]|nr:MAG: hypothetical protein AMJ65_12550 [Phycisphaerae bacterium SG8_4]
MYRKLMCLTSSFALALSLVGVADGQSGTGVRGEYYHFSGATPPSREEAFRDLVAVRIDPQIYCYWNPGFQATHPDGLTPNLEIAPPEGLRGDTFSVRWLGEIEALKSEPYTFITGADDGVRMWLNGEMIIDDWADHDRTESTSDPVQLVAGQRYPIVVEGYENGGEAEWQLYWQSTTMPREVVPQRVLYPVIKAQDYPASDPVPGDGAVVRQTWLSIQWTAGPEAVSHDVYFGDDFDQVKAGTGDTFRGNQAGTDYIVGFFGFPYPEGLAPGTTYYWRIDEVNQSNPDSPWKGPVWSVMVAPVTAFGPDPADSAEDVDPNTAVLRWEVGLDAKLHTVYFGDDYDTVNNAAGAPPTGLVFYSPGVLELARTYYWRVDEFDGSATYKGDVWSFTTPGSVGSPKPPHGAVNVKHTKILSWLPADNAASHQVYFGVDKEAVQGANAGSPEYRGSQDIGSESYDPGMLEWNTAYYWRADKVDAAGNASKGPIWSFTTADFLVVDDFEDYTNNDAEGEAIWQSWIDGFGVAENGSEVGYPMPPYAEQSTIHSGSQSMPYKYDADMKYAEASLTLVYPRDWTERGVDTLGLWFKGDWINVPTPMYVALNGSAAVIHEDADTVQRDVWTEWLVPLQAFADKGIDLTNVSTIAIGFGDRANPQPGGSGAIFFDDIRLYRPAPESEPEPQP